MRLVQKQDAINWDSYMPKTTLTSLAERGQCYKRWAHLQFNETWVSIKMVK